MTYYEILGVNRDASDSVIKTAYRELMKKYHPDKNSTTEAEGYAKEINKAYEVLIDREKRAQYDLLLQPKTSDSQPNNWNVVAVFILIAAAVMLLINMLSSPKKNQFAYK